MSLPPGFLDEIKARVSLSQVVGRKVTWDQRKSNPGRGDMWAPCPFHHEKSASFHVDDRKGFFHCFGCHKGGDIVAFVTETENVGFMEAVEMLAREAGLQIPERDPKQRERADRTSQLTEVMEQALRFFQMQLKTSAATEARAYLERRGLKEADLDRWEIGYAPKGWQGLLDALTGRGVEEKLVLAAGLARTSSREGGRPYDVFRDRIMFPIRDARGRCIAFGGRAMDPNDNAKYLNSPETEIFDKGRTLFNIGPAREASGKGQPLIVAEGYMDVIALVSAGFGGAVAPLGTAVTEDQLRMIWRMSPEPVIALDGDRAGLQAAMRVMDLALPMIEAGQAVRFCLMPEGMDPDELIRAEGPAAMAARLDGALPMVDLLWMRETEGQVYDSPERKAALDKRLREVIGQISDLSLRRHYGDEINALRKELFARPAAAGAFVPGGGGFAGRGGKKGAKRPMAPTQAVKGSMLAAAGDQAADRLREAVILAMLVRHPALVHEFEAELERIECVDADHEMLRTLLLTGRAETEDLMQTDARAALEKLYQPRHVQIAPGVRSDDTEVARMSLAEELAKLAAHRGARAEVEEAVRDFGDLADEGLTWRLGQAAEAVFRAGRVASSDKTDYETGSNGARMSREEKTAFGDLMRNIDFGRGGRGNKRG